MNLYYFLEIIIGKSRVAEVGSLSASAEIGHTNFCHAHICYFHDKCVVSAHDCKFAYLQISSV